MASWPSAQLTNPNPGFPSQTSPLLLLPANCRRSGPKSQYRRAGAKSRMPCIPAGDQCGPEALPSPACGPCPLDSQASLSRSPLPRREAVKVLSGTRVALMGGLCQDPQPGARGPQQEDSSEEGNWGQRWAPGVRGAPARLAEEGDVGGGSCDITERCGQEPASGIRTGSEQWLRAPRGSSGQTGV